MTKCANIIMSVTTTGFPAMTSAHNIRTMRNVLVAGAMLVLVGGCAAGLRQPKPPPVYPDVQITIKIDNTIVLPVSAENKALLAAVAVRMKDITAEQISEHTRLTPTDVCTSKGMRLTIDVISLTLTANTEVSGSILRPKATSKSTNEMLLSQRTRVQTCDGNKLLRSESEEYEEKDIAKIMLKVAEDAASAAERASRAVSTTGGQQ